jgi:hypothetical protein
VLPAFWCYWRTVHSIQFTEWHAQLQERSGTRACNKEGVYECRNRLTKQVHASCWVVGRTPSSGRQKKKSMVIRHKFRHTCCVLQIDCWIQLSPVRAGAGIAVLNGAVDATVIHVIVPATTLQAGIRS